MKYDEEAPREGTLIGYVLGSLDPSEYHAVEAYFSDHPAERVKLESLRHAMEPLAEDRDAFAPPVDLALRTIAHVAEYLVATEPRSIASDAAAVAHFLRNVACPLPTVSARAAKPRPLPPPTDGLELRTVYRRNAIAAVGLAIAFLAVAFPLIAGLRHYRNLEACQNNLRQFSQAMNHYADLHDGAFPVVNRDETAGKMMGILNHSGVFPPGATLTCPGTGHEAPSAGEGKIDYAYTLGYRDESGNLHGMNRNDGDLAWHPLLSDAPLRTNNTAVPNNHRRVHQILFADGHVLTTTHGDVGYERDNIFYNMDSQAHAGVNLLDSVLGRADEQP